MAKMHSRARGRSGSTKPAKKALPTWVRYSEKEVELLIGKLAKEGKMPSQIGLQLRDVYGIPDSQLITKKKITQILKEKDIAPKIPEDLRSLLKRSIQIRKHMESNKQDMTAIRGLRLIESKIRRLVKYYKAKNKLPKNWVYDPATVGIYLT